MAAKVRKKERMKDEKEVFPGNDADGQGKSPSVGGSEQFQLNVMRIGQGLCLFLARFDADGVV